LFSFGDWRFYRIHTDFSSLPDDIDLAVILTPAATVLDAVKACFRQGITRIVIESGGFRELSAAGAELEKELVSFARANGIKFVGPNGISIINRHNGLCLPFMRLSAAELKKGGLSLVSQSGGMALTYLGLGSSNNIGVAKFISMGNKSCLDESDYLAYLKDDPQTDIIGLYLEDIQDGRRLLSRVAATNKPVILHKSNTSAQSSEIASSHTAALANDDQVVDAACQQYGIFRAKTFRQFINQVKSFSLPLMKGDNLVVISRSGGHAVVAADVADEYGFNLVPFSREFTDFITSHFRAQVIKPGNPLDLGDLFDIDFYITILDQVLQRPDVDGVLFNHVFQPDLEGEASLRLALTIDELSQRYHKPVALCIFTGAQAVNRLKRQISFPLFTEPAEGIEALAVSRDYARRQEKAMPEDLPVRGNYDELMGRFGLLADFRGILLQTQEKSLIEMIVGGRRDESFGPVVMLGMGGIYAEIFQDVALRLPPLDEVLINDMIEILKGAPILKGARGQSGIHRPTLYRVLYSLADLLADFPVIKQIDVNPLFLSESAGFVVDGRIMLGK